MKNIFIIITIAMIFVSKACAAPALNPQFLKAQKLESQGNFEQAKKIYESLYKSDDKDIYFYRLISLYVSTRDFKSLEKFALSKLKNHPEHQEAKRYLARAYYGQGEREKARRFLLEVIGDNWKDSSKIKMVAGEFINQSEYNEAINVYITAREKSGDTVLFSIEMARIYTLRENYFSAIEEYLKALEISEVAYTNIEQLIDKAIESGIEIDDLSNLFANYSKKNPGSIKAAKLLSGLFYRAGDYDSSYQVLIGPAVETESASDVWNLAERFKSDRHMEKALEAYKDYYRYFKNASNRVDALNQSASIKHELGLKESAIDDYQILIDDYSGTIHSAYAALRLLELSQDKASFEGYTRILDEFASSTEFREVAFEAYILLGETFMRKGIPDDAKRAFSGARLKARSNNEIYDISVKSAYLHFFEADYEAMSKEIERCIRNLPDGEDINDLLTFKILGLRCSSDRDIKGFNTFSRGHYALYRGEIDDAIENFKEAAQDTSSVIAPYAGSALGKIFKSLESFTEAMKWYLYAADTAQDTTVHVGAIIEAASIAGSELNNRENAKALYLESITTYPGNIYESELRNKLRILVEE